ncbi:MAG: RNA polymerase sigma factor [Ardenticatenaceae bacterium]
MNESTLVSRARQGDESAWESLVRQHQDAVFRLAYLIVGDAADADDVAQEAFIRAYRALDRFDTTRPLRPWLLKIATNLARNRQRAIGRYLAAVRRLLLAEPEPVGVTRREVEQAWEAQLLWQAVRRLRAQDQEIIYLRYFLELSEIEAAETLGIAQGTVKSRLHRALGRLREVVEQDFPLLGEGRKDERARV